MDRNQFNSCSLGCYLFGLFEFLDECFLVDKESFTLIDDDFELTNQDSYTGQKTSVSLKQYISRTTDIKKETVKKGILLFLLMFNFLAYKNLKKWILKVSPS